MNKGFFKQSDPYRVPTTDGKLIHEHFGIAATGGASVSIAKMTAPPGWSEPPQKPDFDEYTLMIKGQKKIIVNGETVSLNAGESLLVEKGSLVQYSNPGKEPAEYWSVCIPAFSPGGANRKA